MNYCKNIYESFLYLLNCRFPKSPINLVPCANVIHAAEKITPSGEGQGISGSIAGNHSNEIGGGSIAKALTRRER